MSCRPHTIGRVMLCLMFTIAGPVLSATELGMMVSGQITDKDGRPQPGIRVGFTCARSATDDTDVVGGHSTPTGADGKFQIVGVPAGECFLLALPPWRSSPCTVAKCGGNSYLTLTIQPGINVEGVVLKGPIRLEPEAEGVVSGQVVDQSGAILPGYGVIADCGSRDCPASGSNCQRLRIDDGDGAFETRLPVGFCRLRACPLVAARLDERLGAAAMGELHAMAREAPDFDERLRQATTCPADWPGWKKGPCEAGEPCAEIEVSAAAAVTGLRLHVGADQP